MQSSKSSKQKVKLYKEKVVFDGREAFTPKFDLGLVEFILAVNLDCAIALGVRNTGEQPPLLHLLVVEEQIARLIDLSVDQHTRARGAGARAAAVGGLDSLLLGGVEDKDAGRALDRLVDPSLLVGGQRHGVSEGGGGFCCAPCGEVAGGDWRESLGGHSKKCDGKYLGEHGYFIGDQIGGSGRETAWRSIVVATIDCYFDADVLDREIDACRLQLLDFNFASCVWPSAVLAHCATHFFCAHGATESYVYGCVCRSSDFT